MPARMRKKLVYSYIAIRNVNWSASLENSLATSLLGMLHNFIFKHLS